MNKTVLHWLFRKHHYSTLRTYGLSAMFARCKVVLFPSCQGYCRFGLPLVTCPSNPISTSMSYPITGGWAFPRTTLCIQLGTAAINEIDTGPHYVQCQICFFHVFSHLIGVELNSQKLSKLDVCTRKSAHASPCPGSQANGWFPQSVAPEATFCSRREMPHHLEKTLSSYSHQPTSRTASGQAFDSCIRANEHHLEDRLAWCAIEHCHKLMKSDEKQRRGQRRKTKGDKHRCAWSQRISNVLMYM